MKNSQDKMRGLNIQDLIREMEME